MKRETVTKIVAAICVAAVLVFAYFAGGTKTDNAEPVQQTQQVTEESVQPAPTEAAGDPIDAAEQSPAAEQNAPSFVPSAESNEPPTAKNEVQNPPQAAVPSAPVAAAQPTTAPEKQENSVHTCTLSVRCDTVLSNLSALDSAKVSVVPENGVIFPETEVVFYEGENVFQVLRREMKQHKIHMEFENTPMYNSAYIEGIGNLYEFDCGELSGWMYRVNGWFPNYGCSRYILADGDRVEWLYTCDLGKDIGGDVADGNGR